MFSTGYKRSISQSVKTSQFYALAAKEENCSRKTCNSAFSSDVQDP